MAADATRFPVRTASLDYVLAYGVLHHVPDPPRVCREIDRVLRPGGLYLGSENGTSVFRGLFELLQRLRPQWYEEAGPEALFSARSFDAELLGDGHDARHAHLRLPAAAPAEPPVSAPRRPPAGGHGPPRLVPAVRARQRRPDPGGGDEAGRRGRAAVNARPAQRAARFPQGQELLVVPDVVGGIVRGRRQHQRARRPRRSGTAPTTPGAAGTARAPGCRAATSLAGRAVVHDHRERPADADQELLALPVGVLAADLLARDVGDDEHPLRHEGHVRFDLGDGEHAPEVAEGAQPDAGALPPAARVARRPPARGAASCVSRVHVAHDPRRAAHHDRARRHGVGHHRAGADHRVRARR